MNKFCTLQGSAVTFVGMMVKFINTLNFCSILCAKNYKNRFIFDGVIQKPKGDIFVGHSV